MTVGQITKASKRYCEYCSTDGFRATLFRIVDSYPHGEAFEWSDECENCEDYCKHNDEGDFDGNCAHEFCDDCKGCYCSECEYKPYRPTNILNITIAVSGGKLMFEDKNRTATPNEGKRYAEINYCPMCGRKLGGLS